jgi:RNA polymerase sigma-70 factor (ECF subfamily)
MDSSTESRFDRLYQRYERQVLAYCLRRTGRPEAFEALNEVFTVAWKRAADMPSDEGALPWLYGVARNVLAHQRRSVARRARLFTKAAAASSSPPPDPESVVVERAEHAAVRAAADRLRPEDREMLLLSAWEGATHSEIAAAMGYSLDAVDKRLARAKERLRRAYESTSRTHRPPASAGKGGDGS